MAKNLEEYDAQQQRIKKQQQESWAEMRRQNLGIAAEKIKYEKQSKIARERTKQKGKEWLESKIGGYLRKRMRGKKNNTNVNGLIS